MNVLGNGAEFEAEEGRENESIGVAFRGAKVYCAWLNKRLLTEAEWEKLMRATDNRRNHYASDFGGESFISSPFAIIPSPYGVAVESSIRGEWVSDIYDQNYYLVSPEINPQGPQIEGNHIYKTTGSISSRPSDTGWFSSSPFRCAQSVP